MKLFSPRARTAFETHQHLPASPQTDPLFIWTVRFSLQKRTFVSQQFLGCGLQDAVQWAGPPSPTDANARQEATSGPKNSLRLTHSHPGPCAFQGLLLRVDFIPGGERISARRRFVVCFYSERPFPSKEGNSKTRIFSEAFSKERFVSSTKSEHLIQSQFSQRLGSCLWYELRQANTSLWESYQGKRTPRQTGEQSHLKAAHSGLVGLKFIELDDPDFEKSNLPNDSLYVFPEPTDNGHHRI